MEPLEKRCKACQRVLSIEAFEKNQYLKGNIVANEVNAKNCRSACGEKQKATAVSSCFWEL